MSMKQKAVPAGTFKQGCLAILDDVAATHRTVVITKRGRPVARVVPVISDREREEELLAALRGKAKMLVPEEEFLAPPTQEAGWSLGGDDE
jgi:prevent-host-death family protein